MAEPTRHRDMHGNGVSLAYVEKNGKQHFWSCSDDSSDEGEEQTEAVVFAAEGRELKEVHNMLQRAVAILEREMAGGASKMLWSKLKKEMVPRFQRAVAVLEKDVTHGASTMQLESAALLDQALSILTDDSDTETGAPAVGVSQCKSGGTADAMRGLLEKAEGRLDAVNDAGCVMRRVQLGFKRPRRRWAAGELALAVPQPDAGDD